MLGVFFIAEMAMALSLLILEFFAKKSSIIMIRVLYTRIFKKAFNSILNEKNLV